MDAAPDADPVTFTPARVRVRRRIPPLLWAVAAVALAGVTYGNIASDLLLKRMASGLLGVTALALGLVHVMGWALFGQGAEGTLRVEGRTLFVERGDRRDAFSLDRLASGVVLPGAVARVRIETRDRTTVEADFLDEAEADRCLDALGLDGAQRAIRFAERSPLRMLATGLGGLIVGTYVSQFLAMLLVAVTGIPALFGVMPVLMVLWAALGALAGGRAAVHVGLDGLYVHHVWGKRFIPYAQLQGVTSRGRIPVVVWKDGRYELLSGTGVEVSDESIQAFLHRVERVMGRARGRRHGPMHLAQLERNGRSVEDWHRDLRAMFDRGATAYRGIQFGPDEALSVLEDPEATPEQRMGAALALSGSADPDARTRVRVAADASANEAMREVLTRASEGEVDDAAVTRALASREPS